VKIYTRGGDKGETTLLGGVRVAKNDPRVIAYGTVDELNAALGVVIALENRNPSGFPPDELRSLQEDLFTLGARLAAVDPERALRKGMIPALAEDRIAELEAWIDRLNADLPALDAFVLPGGSIVAAQLHVARTICRRAERNVMELFAEQPDLAEVVIPYLNRLSDLLFMLARYVNHQEDHKDTLWLPQRRLRDDNR
jgi:cob(I)alamin adenosyltransferase